MLPTDFASTVAFETAADAEDEAEAEAEAEADAAVGLDEATELDAAVDALVVGDEPPAEHAAMTTAAVSSDEKVRALERMVQPPAEFGRRGDIQSDTRRYAAGFIGRQPGRRASAGEGPFGAARWPCATVACDTTIGGATRGRNPALRSHLANLACGLTDELRPHRSRLS
jgi:hypothetical protein